MPRTSPAKASPEPAERPPATPERTPEAALAGLVTTRTNLQGRQAALTVEVERAVAARREVLISGADAAATAEAERACREIESTALGVADVLAEIDRRIAATEQRIADARAEAEREATAASLERDGEAIDAAAERVRQAVAALAKAQAALTAAITPTAAPHFGKYDRGGRRDYDPPEVVAAYLTGHMLATALPGIDVSEAPRKLRFAPGWTDRLLIEATDGDAPARTLLTEPMREAAADIRSGEASPDLPRYDRPEPDFIPAVPEVQVYVLEPFRYGTGEGRMPQSVSSVVQSLPVPVAEAAIAAGYASKAEPRNLADIQARFGPATRGVNIFSYPDLGFDLAEWKADEAARRRAEWLARQEQQAA